MSRLQKQYKRKEEFRDAKLIYIAVEGILTEKIYFEKLALEYKNSRTKILIIPRESTDSSPEFIFDNLIEKLPNYDDIISDNVFIVIDRDQWPQKIMSKVEKSCYEKGYKFIVSNPCFELWLLLHYEDISTFDQSTKELIKKNKKVTKAKNAKKYIEKSLSDIAGGYNKTNETSIAKFIPLVNIAITNAEKMNPPSLSERGWPDKLCTQVHFLVEEIMKYNI